VSTPHDAEWLEADDATRPVNADQPTREQGTRPFPHEFEGQGKRCLACNEPKHMHPGGGVGGELPSQWYLDVKADRDRLAAELAGIKKIAERKLEAIQAALNELGVPTPDYSAPVTNAVKILTAALSGVSGGEGER
jgi:hypothetical protein